MVTANGGNGGSGSYGGDGIGSIGGVAISGGTVTANGGNGGNGGDGICSSGIDLSGSLELTAKAGSPSGRALSQNGDELDLNTIKDKLGPGAKVTATDANGKVNQVSIPRPVESVLPLLPLLPLLTAALPPRPHPPLPPRSDCHRQGRPAHLLHQHPERQYPHRLRRTVHSLLPHLAGRAASAAG